MTNDWRERIVSDPTIHHGEPCIKGTRVSVAVIVANLAELSVDQLLEAYPQLVKEDIKSALLFASECSHSTLVA
ncbi:MAG: DUF433 domain-containing protein [Burkholderiales bacterium]|nr:DUF433 domain-containing protein [Phycisphaerae bacterium]